MTKCELTLWNEFNYAKNFIHMSWFVTMRTIVLVDESALSCSAWYVIDGSTSHVIFGAKMHKKVARLTHTPYIIALWRSTVVYHTHTKEVIWASCTILVILGVCEWWGPLFNTVSHKIDMLLKTLRFQTRYYELLQFHKTKGELK